MFFSNKTSCEGTILRVLGTETMHPFWCCWIPTKTPWNHFCGWWRIFNAFVSTCVVAFCTTHKHNKTCEFNTEGFVPVASLCGVVYLLYWFTKCFIGITGNIWLVVYMNEKCIYLSETRACTIIECVIVWKFWHATSTWTFKYFSIYLTFGSRNKKR